jgi:hypothetical protein
LSAETDYARVLAFAEAENAAADALEVWFKKEAARKYRVEQEAEKLYPDDEARYQEYVDDNYTVFTDKAVEAVRKAILMKAGRYYDPNALTHPERTPEQQRAAIREWSDELQAAMKK